MLWTKQHALLNVKKTATEI